MKTVYVQSNMTNLLLLAVVLLLFLNLSQSEPTGAVVQGVVCETPYVRHGASCCLDTDDNGICDTDQREPTPERETPTATPNEATPFMLPSTSISNTREGYTIAIDNFAYTIYDGWAKITNVNFTLINRGDHSISPVVSVSVHPVGSNDDIRPPRVDLNTALHPGEYLRSPAYVDASFTEPHTPQILELTLKDDYTFPAQPLVSVRTKFTPKRIK